MTTEISEPDALAEYPETIMQRIRDADFSDILEDFVYDLEDDHREFFAGEHSPEGSPWAPHAASTQRAKMSATALDNRPRILKDTGRLQDSVGGSDSPDAIREFIDTPTEKGVRFGTSVPYGIYHQRGTRRMPQRKFLGVTPERLADFKRKILERLAEIARGE